MIIILQFSFLIIGLFTVLHSLRERKLVNVSWPVTSGKIVQFEPFKNVFTASEGTATDFYIILNYVYHVNGVEYSRKCRILTTSDTFTPWRTDTLPEHRTIESCVLPSKLLREIANDYQSGKSVEVQYNPDRPSNSVLYSDKKLWIWMLLLGLITVAQSLHALYESFK